MRRKNDSNEKRDNLEFLVKDRGDFDGSRT